MNMFDLKRICDIMLKERPFYGVLMQYLRLQLDSSLPAPASIGYNLEAKRIVLKVNPIMQAEMTELQQVADIIHELSHITKKHIFVKPKYIKTFEPEKHKRWNIAMDLVNNQEIDNMSPNSVCYKKFKDINGNPFPDNKTTEEYFDLLEGVDLSGWGDPNHNWELPEDALRDMHNTLKKALYQARSLIVTDKHFHKDVGSAQDAVDAIEKAIKALDYKSLLNHAVRKSLPATSRVHTWTRPSRRYGNQAPGTKASMSPKVCNYIDTSGSIGEIELLDMMGHAGNILRLLNAEVTVKYFHDKVYGGKKYKPNEKIVFNKVESGGTDLQPVIESIYAGNDDLSIVFTDGYYGDVDIPVRPDKKIIFVISKDGQADHPLKRFGITVKAV